MEYEKCYVYEPTDVRPAKKRRTEPSGLQASWRRREEAYRRAWTPCLEKIQSTLTGINAGTVEEVSSFLEDCYQSDSPVQIPAGYIVAGASAASQTSLLQRILQRSTSKRDRAFALLSSGSATNLKGALKTVIQKTTAIEASADDDDDDEEEVQTTRGGPRLLNYDLQLLANFVHERKLKQVVIGFLDSEAFDSRLLSELIEFLGYWRDRIPFVFLFHIATSTDFLQQRLSNAAVRQLHGRSFEVVSVAEELEQVFQSIITSESSLWIGPNLIAMSVERLGDYVQGIETFVDTVQYAFMSTYYANALSIFLNSSLAFDQIPGDHFEAVRNLPSFQAHCQDLASSSSNKHVRRLLDSDEDLLDLIRTETETGRRNLADMMIAIDVVRQIQSCISPGQAMPRSKLYIQAMSNKLQSSTLLRNLLLTIRKSPSTTASDILDGICSLDLPNTLLDDFKSIRNDLSTLLKEHSDSAQPLRSEDDLRNSTLRTTVVAQKVELSKQKSTLSKQDTAYTALLRSLTDLLDTYFSQVLIDPTTLVFHEIFLYDLKSPHRETLTPRPRHAIERALVSPHDYLDCDCCGPKAAEDNGRTEATLAASQPATALLYQLYLESGTLINVHDLWQAFKAVAGSDKNSDEEGKEDGETLALFQRALAELRYLGFIKGTRRRVDHVLKVAWKGL